jgi:four helix bundle protein
MDFVHKLGIAQKECDETLYWLELLYETELFEADLFKKLSS